MGAHADYFEEFPQHCCCDLQHTEGQKGYHVVRIREDCPTHGKPENLADDATRRQREIAERKWT